MMENEAVVVSVIIPTYNRADLIGKAISSVLCQQDAPAMEILVMDDGSTDGTAEVIRNLSDQRIRYYRLDHRGACAARNEGIRKATGEYIAFQDSDDFWYPDKLAKQIREIRECGADVVCNAYMYHDESVNLDARYPEDWVPEGRVSATEMLTKSRVSTQMVLGKRECFLAEQFNEGYPRFQDWELAVRLSEKYKVFYFSEVLADVYMSAGSISSKPELALNALGQLLWDHADLFAKSREATDAFLAKYSWFSAQKGEGNAVQKELRRLQTECNNLNKEAQIKQRKTDRQIRELTDQVEKISRELEEVYHTFSWRVTGPLRKIRGISREPFSRKKE